MSDLTLPTLIMGIAAFAAQPGSQRSALGVSATVVRPFELSSSPVFQQKPVYVIKNADGANVTASGAIVSFGVDGSVITAQHRNVIIEVLY